MFQFTDGHGKREFKFQNKQRRSTNDKVKLSKQLTRKTNWRHKKKTRQEITKRASAITSKCRHIEQYYHIPINRLKKYIKILVI